MEVFNFDTAWEFLKEGKLIKRLRGNDADILGMTKKNNIYKLIPWVSTTEDLNADDWTEVEENES